MNQFFLDFLKENRDKVEEAYSKEMRLNASSVAAGSVSAITSKKFFFQVVFDHFANLSKIKINRCLRDRYHLMSEFWNAVHNAERAIYAPVRKAETAERMAYFAKYKSI